MIAWTEGEERIEKAGAIVTLITGYTLAWLLSFWGAYLHGTGQGIYHAFMGCT
jgi:hypothetical protein|tara:strand:+ start:165 stop:323 length:159 start_codon:yes stop_codon:yes gene_type:complete